LGIVGNIQSFLSYENSIGVFQIMDRRLFNSMTKIQTEVNTIKSEIREIKRGNRKNSQSEDKILKSLELIDYEATETLNNTLLEIEERQHGETLYKGKGKPRLRLIKNDK
jgi:hypothetical protein